MSTEKEMNEDFSTTKPKLSEVRPDKQKNQMYTGELMQAFAFESGQAAADLAEALGIGKLAEHHGDELG